MALSARSVRWPQPSRISSSTGLGRDTVASLCGRGILAESHPLLPFKPCRVAPHPTVQNPTAENSMNRLVLALLLGLTFAGAAQARHDANDDLDIDNVNATIHVPDHAT